MTEELSNGVTESLSDKLMDIHDALDRAAGDSDPLYLDDDMTDDELRSEEPLLWASKEIIALAESLGALS